jgi:ribonuclease HII
MTRLRLIDDFRSLSLSELQKLVLKGTPEAALLDVLKADGRVGAQRLYQQLQRRLSREREENERLRALYSYERTLEVAGCGPVAGVDEAGRGPLAGPVVAAAVILSGQAIIPALKDSKLLSSDARRRIAEVITTEACAWGIGIADVAEIERLNILQASLLAMRRALAVLGRRPGWVLVDGTFTVPGYAGGQTALVGGDRVSATVAAASILAKVYRDELMEHAHHHYPHYGFDRHKGYATAEHYRALARYGPCPLHRPSFLRRRFSSQYNSGCRDTD